MFFDYRKSFDSVPHLPLLKKLENLGFNDHILHWISGYLTSRSQTVVVNGESSLLAPVISGVPQGSVLCLLLLFLEYHRALFSACSCYFWSTTGLCSQPAPVISGVPQGSVLGPLLFLIYINDLTEINLRDGAKITLYADYVLLFRVINSPEDFDRLQIDIDAVGNWSSINFLTLNRDKCKYMIVSRRKTVSTPSSPLLLEGYFLEQVEMFKYVGVLQSHDLSWGEHIQAICSKARKILGLLYRRFYNNAPSSTLLQLYISLVRPHLDYASAIWSPYLTKDKIELENIQKFACRMATGLWDTSYQDLLELVDLPTLECRRLETRLCLLYNIIYKLYCFNQSTFTLSTSLSHHAPHNLVLNRPFARTNSYFYSFVPQSIFYWNALDSSIVCTTSVNAFYKYLHSTSLV